MNSNNAAVLAALPANVANIVAMDIQANPALTVIPKKYYSSIFFIATKAGDGPYTYTIAQQTTAKAFTYSVGQDMGAAGNPGVLATLAHTNLQNGPSQTNDNADVVVWGIAAQLVEVSEPNLCPGVWANASNVLQLSSQNRTTLAPLSAMPGAGGLYGFGRSTIAPGLITDAAGEQSSFLANGNPAEANQYLLPLPFRWNSVGGQNKDSTLQIITVIEEAVVAAGADVAAAAPASADGFQGVPGFTAATIALVEIRWVLQCVEISNRSVNF